MTYPQLAIVDKSYHSTRFSTVNYTVIITVVKNVGKYAKDT